MLEKKIEQRLMAKAKANGGLAMKWTSPGNPGVCDRICLLPGGRVVFVELKAPGKKPTPLQAKVHRMLMGLGMDVRVLDSVEAVDAFFR